MLQATDRDFQSWVRAGELRRAGEWLVHRFAGEVVGLCGAMVRDRHAAEDLAQDVFGRAFASLGGYRGDASPRTWVLAIARNRCIDHLRSRKRDPWGGRGEDTDPDNQAAETPLAPDLLMRRDDVEQALASLAEGERALVVLRYRHGLDYKELAAAFGLREGTARMRVSRALARMREQLTAVPLGEAAPHMVQEYAADADEEMVDGAAPAPARQPPPAPRAVASRRRASRGAPPAPEAPQLRRPPAPAQAPPAAASSIMGGAPPPGFAPAPPADGLAAFLTATDPGVPSTLKARLLDLAGQLQ